MQNFKTMADFLKQVHSALTEINVCNAEIAEVLFTYLPEDETINIEAVFFVPTGYGESEMIVASSTVREVYLTQYNDNYLFQQVCMDIITNLQDKLLDKSNDVNDNLHITVH